MSTLPEDLVGTRAVLPLSLRCLVLAALAFELGGQSAPPARGRTDGKNASATVQLLVTHARVLDVRTGRVNPQRTVVIDGGRIVQVLDDSLARARRIRARDTLDARTRLVTPALVDAHFHTEFVLGDSSLGTGGFLTHLVNRPDSSRAYRRRISAAFLPYGVTLVRDVGSATEDLALLRSWMTREPDAPDLLPSGAQLVSPEPGRKAPPFQAVVRDSADAAAQVRAYAAMGFRNVKLYWRLQAAPLHGALIEATQRGMTATAHLDDGIVTFDQALTLGVRHFEHAHTIAISVLSRAEVESAVIETARLLGVPPVVAMKQPGAFVLYTLEQWRRLGDRDARLLALIERLRTTGSTLTPTLHILAQRVGRTSVTTPPTGTWDDVERLTPAQRMRAAANYDILARTVAQMDARGIRLAVGSDTQLPGRAVLDELLLLHAAGIPNWRVLRIATLYSAEAVGAGQDYGAVEPGRRADLVIFDADPLVEMRAVLGRKTVIKDGVIAKITGA